jgi:cardiolipin synthase
MSPTTPAPFRWLRTGDEAFGQAVAAMDAALETVDFEVYIYADSSPGTAVRDALVRAAKRGLRVRTLVDAFGSFNLPDSYWNPLRAAGGQIRWFNPLTLRRFNIRNHRKLLVCDRRLAFVGGFNVSNEWMGDGVTQGWRDLGLAISGPITDALQASYDAMFELAAFRHRRLPRLRRTASKSRVLTAQGELILSGPGRGRSPIRLALMDEFARAGDVRIIAAYFLPPNRLRRALTRVATRGGRVQLILPALTDVPLLQAATRGLYGRLLRSGVQIHEYQPQILHTKFVLCDSTVFLGSANLDPRSLSINYDLLVRIQDPRLAEEARGHFAAHLEHCRPINGAAWRRQRTLWAKLLERLACFLFLRIDPLITRRQLRSFR